MPRDKVKINVKEKLEDNVLDLSLLEITEVPVRDIAALKRATTLDLSNNKIGFLGKNFATLTQITKLDLSKNEIKFLPDNFGELLNLRHLDLYNNKLEHLPLSFGNLSKLRYLDLKANPLNPALLKIVGPCLSSKDCADAAKRVIPFMFNIEKEVKAEQKRKQEEEDRLRQEEEKKRIEEEKTAKKKQAKKDKQYRDKLRKREAENREKLLQDPADDLINENGSAMHEHPFRDQSPQSPGILFKLVKFLVLLAVFLAITFIISMRFFPQQSDKIMEFLPIQHQVLIRSFYKKCAILIHHYFDKALNLYKFN